MYSPNMTLWTFSKLKTTRKNICQLDDHELRATYIAWTYREFWKSTRSLQRLAQYKHCICSSKGSATHSVKVEWLWRPLSSPPRSVISIMSGTNYFQQSWLGLHL